MYEVKLLPQEGNGSSKFNGQMVMTRGFKTCFGELASIVAIITHNQIIQERVHSMGAEYLQVAIFQGIKFYVIDDGPIITFLLPEEY